MKKVTFSNWKMLMTSLLFACFGLFMQTGAFAQCTPTAGFPDPPGSLVCPGVLTPSVVFAEDFNAGGGSFGVFTEDPAPGGTNDLTVSTLSDTPSSITGPECPAVGAASTNEEFIFLESSSALTGEVHCMSTVIDLTAESAPLELSFWYYMFGSNIGELTVNVNGGNVFTAGPGQIQTGQFDPWLQGSANLDAFAGSVITLQICMEEGSGASTFRGDISIDHIQIFGCALPPPIISCPMDVMANTDPGVCTAQVSFSQATAIDPDGGPVVVVQTMGPPSGSDFPIGDTIIEFTATDDEGDTATCQFTITVNDNEPPMVTCPPDVTVDSDPGICGAVVTYPSPTVVDNCFMGGGIANDELSTIFAGGNGLGANATVYFDATVDVNDIMVTEIDVNTDATAGSTVNADIYLIPSGTYVGNETNPGAWGAAVATASGPSAGTNNPTALVLGAPITLSANTTYAVAVFMDASVNYTNGNGANEQSSNSDLTLDLGSASSGLFSGSVFSPRVWNGTVRYEYTVSNAPYTVITGFPSGGTFPVGTTLTTLEYTDPGGNAVTCTFNVTVNDIEPPTVSCIGTPGPVPGSATDAPALAIPDNDPIGVSTTITVADAGAILDMDVDLDISHTWVGDLIVTLESPGGTVVTLIDQMGVPASTFGCSNNDMQVTLDDEAVDPIEDECSSSPISGSYTPEQALSAFDTEEVMGVWILTVSDNAGGDTGMINSWTLNYDYDSPGIPMDVVLDANGMASVPATMLATGWDDNCGPGGVIITGGVGGAYDQTINIVNPALMGTNLFSFTGTPVGANGDAILEVMTFGDIDGTGGNEEAWTITDEDTNTVGMIGATGSFADQCNTVLTETFMIPAALIDTWAADGQIDFTGTDVAGNINTTLCGGDNLQLRLTYATGTSMMNVEFTCDDLGLTDVIITATDAAGNSSTCTALVNVIDNTPPVLVCADVTIELGPDGTADIEPEDLLASSPVIYEVITISSDNGSGTEGFTDFTMNVTAAEVVSFDWDYTTPDGPAFDGFGYLLNGVFTELTDPAGANTQSGNSGPINLAAGDVFGFRSQSDDGIFGAATTTISGFVPGFVGQFDPANWTLTLNNSDGDAFFVFISGGPLSFDACGITVLAVDITEVTCADIAASPLTATVFASDASGNLAACQSMITVVDALGPEVTCPADMTVDPGPGNLFYTLPDYWADGDATATDNCTDPLTIFTQDPAAGTELSDGVYTISICSTDEYGNEGCCTFQLTVESILGNTDNELSSAISLYPNPAGEQVTLANGSNILLDNLVIFDVNGKLVNTIDLRNMGSEMMIDVSQLASGVYMVQITGEQSTTVKRLIKE